MTVLDYLLSWDHSGARKAAAPPAKGEDLSDGR